MSHWLALVSESCQLAVEIPPVISASLPDTIIKWPEKVASNASLIVVTKIHIQWQRLLAINKLRMRINLLVLLKSLNLFIIVILDIMDTV